MTPFVKNTLTVAAICGILYTGYYFYTLKQDASLNNTGTSVNEGALKARSFLVRLDSLEEIQLSDQIFSDERFISLLPNEFPIDPVPVGTKPNPFVER